MSFKESILSAEYIRERLTYDPLSGVFFWNIQPGNDHKTRRWNGKNAGREAGTKGSKGYVVIGIDGRFYQAHRLAWIHFYGSWPPEVIDHIDGNPGNNRIANLRTATQRQNCYNRRLQANNSSGRRGVHWNDKVGKWRAGIRVNNRIIHLGHYSSLDDAYAAYRAEAERHFGHFFQGGADEHNS